jgi:hypothetical protein
MPPAAALLPLHFDPAGLQSDLASLPPGEWHAHFNTAYFSGDWSGAALRSTGDGSILADQQHGDFADTELLRKCAHLRRAIEVFQCPLRSVRLLRLTAGSIIKEHRDYELGYEAGEVRLHIPVITNPQVEFYLDNRRILMQPGECWYLDLNRPHRVQNLGSTDRVHLVIDCQLNDWLRQLIASGKPHEGSESGFEAFRLAVLADPGLQNQLITETDRNTFITRLTQLGQQRGHRFLETDVEASLQAARRAMMERWIA